MPKKPLKIRRRKAKFEDWELDYMKNGPPPWDVAKESPHRWHYLDGRDIWERLRQEPDFDEKNFPYAVKAYREKY